MFAPEKIEEAVAKWKADAQARETENAARRTAKRKSKTKAEATPNA